MANAIHQAFATHNWLGSFFGYSGNSPRSTGYIFVTHLDCRNASRREIGFTKAPEPYRSLKIDKATNNVPRESLNEMTTINTGSDTKDTMDLVALCNSHSNVKYVPVIYKERIQEQF